MQTGISGILGIPECPVVSSSFIYQGFRSTILSSFRFVSFFFFDMTLKDVMHVLLIVYFLTDNKKK